MICDWQYPSRLLSDQSVIHWLIENDHMTPFAFLREVLQSAYVYIALEPYEDGSLLG